MPARKIQDEQEILRWFKEGRTYAWMSEEYERKYNITVVPSFWSNIRHRWGLPPRAIRDDDMIPWAVKPEHRNATIIRYLRFAARRLAGRPNSPTDEQKLDTFLATLAEANVVVHYDPELEDGFVLVRREPSDAVDDIIRRPKLKTTRRRSRDK